jgi:flagellar FliL protein
VKKKLLLIVTPAVVVLIAAAGAYKLVLAPPPAPAPKPKIDGALVTLDKEFLVNLAGGRYGKVSVALLIDSEHAPGGGHGAGEPVKLPQDAAVRSIITDHLTGLDAAQLILRKPRQRLLKTLAEELGKHTDEHVKRVMFTDIAVQ